MSERSLEPEATAETEIEQAVEDSLLRSTRDSLAPVALVVGLAYAVLTPSHVFFVERPTRLVVVGSAAVSALLCLGLWLRWRWRPPAPERASRLMALLASVVFVNVGLHLLLSGEPRQTTNLALLALGSGFLFLDSAWLLVVLGSTLGVWVLAAAVGPPSPDWTHFGFLLGGASAVAIAAHSVRRRSERRLERERLLTERERSRVAGELGRVASELRRRNLELERRNRELDDFAHVASHDLQQPLRTMASYAQLLRTDLPQALPDAARTDLEFIEAAAHRMHALVQDLLRLSRAGSAALRPQRLRVDAVVDGTLDLLAVAVEESRARIVRDPLPELETDPTLLASVYQNLIGNALKFACAQPARIHLTAEPGEDGWVLGVRDEGPGIPPESHEEVFQPFRRLDGSAADGTGIGLAICRRAVERLGGRIWVESSGGHGAHFRFVVAASPEAQGPDAERSVNRAPAGDGGRGAAASPPETGAGDRRRS